MNVIHDMMQTFNVKSCDIRIILNNLKDYFYEIVYTYL